VLRLESADLADVDWAQLDSFGDRTVFQTREWLEFLVATQGGEPVVARVLDRDEELGWFTGLVVKRFGLRILGSPFQGWTTGPMGFNLREDASYCEAVEALFGFAFGELRCVHVEMLDRELDFGQLQGMKGVELSPFGSFEIDLTASEDDLFAAMSSACRRAIRKSEKVGVRVERAYGEGFADEYYPQLEDVFGKQSLSPPYSVERVREMIRSVEPSGRLLMLRALSPDDEPIASAIFPVFKGFAYFWGGASWRSKQIMRPNEAIFWHAIRHVKQLGVPAFDLGGGGDYKRKYGGVATTRPFVRRSRLPGLMAMRKVAARAYWWSATRQGKATTGSG
jgi:Acetyltransferase (GNAT) domain